MCNKIKHVGSQGKCRQARIRMDLQAIQGRRVRTKPRQRKMAVRSLDLDLHREISR